MTELLEIPEEDFQTTMNRMKLQEIVAVTKKLNAELKKITVYRSYKPHGSKNPTKVTKKYLQLTFCVVTKG